ncbi:MAG: hypothetical protein V3S64_15640, partial [bacterium]
MVSENTGITSDDNQDLEASFDDFILDDDQSFSEMDSEIRLDSDTEAVGGGDSDIGGDDLDLDLGGDDDPDLDLGGDDDLSQDDAAGGDDLDLDLGGDD